MVLVCNTLPRHDTHVYQTIFKSHYVRLSYGPDTILEHKHTHSQRERGKTLYALPPFYGGGHKKESKTLTNQHEEKPWDDHLYKEKGS